MAGQRDRRPSPSIPIIPQFAIGFACGPAPAGSEHREGCNCVTVDSAEAGPRHTQHACPVGSARQHPCDMCIEWTGVSGHRHRAEHRDSCACTVRGNSRYSAIDRERVRSTRIVYGALFTAVSLSDRSSPRAWLHPCDKTVDQRFRGLTYRDPRPEGCCRVLYSVEPL